MTDERIIPPALYLEGITTCVNDSGLLDTSLKENLHHFDGFVVVTTHEDVETQEVCQRHGVSCVKTDAFNPDGEPFNKGSAINLGLAYLKNRGWVCQFDSNIILPDRFRMMLSKSSLDPRCIYGADRLNIASTDQWEELKSNHFRQFHSQFHGNFMLVSSNLELGTRVVHDEFGYAPMGFFQLWNANQVRVSYPHSQGAGADRNHVDLLFSCQWRREDRRLLPTVIVYNLEINPAKDDARVGCRIHVQTQALQLPVEDAKLVKMIKNVQVEDLEPDPEIKKIVDVSAAQKMVFENDWFSGNIPLWTKVLSPLAGTPLNFLEIGSSEGRSACWLLSNVLTHPDSRLTTVDCGYHANFDSNIFLTGAADKVGKITGLSVEMVPRLKCRAYDFVYVDGSHDDIHVIADLVNSLRCLKMGGILAMDDYPTVKGSIDAFLSMMEVTGKKFEVIDKGYQVWIKKLNNFPDYP